MHEVSPDLEGFGTVHAYFVDVGDLNGSHAPLPAPSLQRTRSGGPSSAVGKGLPYMIGVSTRIGAAASAG